MGTPNGKLPVFRSNPSRETSCLTMDEKVDRADIAWPIVEHMDHEAPSVFRPEALLREARRQKQLPLVAVPEVCLLDPDGDVVRHIKEMGNCRTHEGWACYHTELLAFDLDGVEVASLAARSALHSRYLWLNSSLHRAAG